ncbi:MAG: hypothetical protein DRQ47_07550 [Gammaproteobacteria bacterium]|nr:MAG: hypothetical protein DRQ47_07550 [Gammaproteobacteria bacterium]
MKSLTEYVAEAKETYDYRVKVAGNLPAATLTQFKAGLGKFDLVSCSKPKATPITKDPIGFPGIENESVNILNIVLNYPASADAIADQGRLAGIDLNRIIVVNGEWDDSMTAQQDAQEDTTLLDTPEYPKDTKEQTDASTKYSDSFKDIVGNAANTTFEVAGGKTPKAKFNTDSPGFEESPMTKETRPKTEDLLK